MSTRHLITHHTKLGSSVELVSSTVHYSEINVPNIVKLRFQIYLFKFQCMVLDYRIAGKFGGEKVWRIDSFQALSERKFGELLDQPIDYQL